MMISRTYPQPDSPEPHLGPRERALAVFKYLLDIEPEVAKDHPLFACIKHAFEQAEQTGFDCGRGFETERKPSLVPMLTSERTADWDARRYVADEGKL
jgi:hypothetical protein